MSHIEENFFALLKSTLSNTTPILPHTPSIEEWKEIVAISKEQTISGIMLDGIAKLPPEQKPPTTIILQQIAIQKNIEKLNCKMNDTITNIITQLEQKNIRTYLLKGQGVALNYPIPHHRICGDIDLYFSSEHYGKAIEHFQSLGCTIDDSDIASHAETEYNGIKIEIHKKSSTYYTKKLQKRYEATLDTLLKEKKEYITINNKQIEVFPHMANALQLLSHMMRHIIFSGLGLRQVCDWCLFIKKYQDNIDKEKFIALMKELKLFETYKAITAISIYYLALPSEYALCELTQKDKKLAKKVLNLIMRYGNFGHYGEHSITSTKWEYAKSYAWKIKNCIRFRKIACNEAWNYPIWQLHTLKKIIK